MGKNNEVASMFCAPQIFFSCDLRHGNLLENRVCLLLFYFVLFFSRTCTEAGPQQPCCPLDVCGRVLSLCLPGTGSQL